MRKGDRKPCQLDYSQIDEVDEEDGDEVMALIWCNTHRTYEWRWVPQELVG
jgi:hypothetical protein